MCGRTCQPDDIRYWVAFGDGGTSVWVVLGCDTKVHSVWEQFHLLVDTSGVGPFDNESAVYSVVMDVGFASVIYDLSSVDSKGSNYQVCEQRPVCLLET